METACVIDSFLPPKKEQISDAYLDFKVETLDTFHSFLESQEACQFIYKEVFLGEPGEIVGARISKKVIGSFDSA